MPELDPRLVQLVKEQEGLVLKPYICPAGYPTIGYGHRIPSLDHEPITEYEAEALLWADLQEAQRKALLIVPGLRGGPLAALTDLVYNVGAGYAVRESGLVALLRAEDWKNAAARFRQWDKAKVGGKLQALPGLTKRRAIGASWIEEGIW